MRRAKIVATIGPASESPERLRELIIAGMDVARINMSHGERAGHSRVIKRIRGLAEELSRPVGVMLDLSGPKIRTGKIEGGEVLLEEGAEIRIVPGDFVGNAFTISCNYDLLPREVSPGDRILISDGEIELAVIKTAPDHVVATVIHGGKLGEHKGINLPGAQISIPSITDKDIIDLKFGLEHGIDLVAQSFVRRAGDCVRARDLISEFGGDARLIAKIEKPEAIDDLANILEVVDGVMVARGDLAVETSTERVPVLQKKIIADGLMAEKAVITATQMLQSMIENPRPTRAEASDVSNAILDGSDALMLSGETAVGRFPVETVKMMDRIIRSTEEMVVRTDLVQHALFGRRSGSYGRAIAEAAAFAAHELGCRLIVVISQSGHMARRIAALRPRQRIIALTPVEKSCQQLTLSWGVEPFILKGWVPGANSLLACTDRALLEYGLAERRESVVVMAGRLEDITVSLSMKVHRAGDLFEENQRLASERGR